jgi:hypothetical protein
MALQGKVALLVCEKTCLYLKTTCLFWNQQTGASMGIGEAIASSLVEAGVNVILFSRSQVSPSPHPQSHQMI